MSLNNFINKACVNVLIDTTDPFGNLLMQKNARTFNVLQWKPGADSSIDFSVVGAISGCVLAQFM